MSANPFRFEAAGLTFALTPLTNRRIREIAAATGIDVRDAVEKSGRFVELMLGEQTAALTWVYDLVKGQHPDVTFERFTDDLTGDQIDRLLTTTWEWVADFFRQTPFGRVIRAKGVPAVVEMIEAEARKLAADPERLRTLTATAGSAPESSASTPTSGASGS